MKWSPYLLVVGPRRPTLCRPSSPLVAQVRIAATREVGADAGARAYIVACIDDDGPGLDPEARQSALQRGRRLDESRPGSGLGLSIVVDLAAIYGGSLQLEASPLGGLRARLRLPSV